ncbi:MULTISPECIES: GIY-YIG nuclease family protein [Colwelliaceae]|mgnify:CR=1 FL=1|uniref:GIY-YIG nuclease family protein n=1 Tax=Colwelliaceae TaxID=267889 RepID=UPI0009714AF5|nr:MULTISPECIES: GIY-YIG nuclease family protein [Colwelliaceae]
MSSNWYVYFVRCSDNSLYTGITTDLNRRIDEHNHSNKLGAKYTRVRRPVELVYWEQQLDRKTASQREYQLKQLKKSTKEDLIKKNKQKNNI